MSSKTKTEEVKTDRRGFLKFAGIGTVAGGAALVTGKSAEAEETVSEAPGSSYSETDHVKTFYASARF